MTVKFHLLTIFPRFFDSYLTHSLVAKGLEKNLFSVKIHDLRDYTHDVHRSVDDLPYGGGSGMVFRPEPLTEAIEKLRGDFKKGRVIYLSCQGPLFRQEKARQLAKDYEEILFVCGRYEGIDQRVIDSVIDEEISIGDYVLAGGEIPALVVMDALIRLIPGVVGKPDSLTEESFEAGLLEYPHYTRPELFRGREVPRILRSGHHREIRLWRLQEAIKKTLKNRPDLLEKQEFPLEIRSLIDKIKSES